MSRKGLRRAELSHDMNLTTSYKRPQTDTPLMAYGCCYNQYLFYNYLNINNLILTKMEKDTVLLAVEKYNELRDFKQKIEEGKTLVIIDNRWTYSKKFVTESEAVKIAVQDNEILQKKLDELTAPKEISINDLKKMSYWEFRKWRKS